MTDKTTEALRLAEEALEELHYSSGTVKAVTLYKSALAAIREALAEQEKQEPVAVISESAIGLVKLHSNGVCLPFGTQLYTAPVSAKREWVDLTDYEIVRLYDESLMCNSEMIAFARAVIAAYKEKNK